MTPREQYQSSITAISSSVLALIFLLYLVCLKILYKNRLLYIQVPFRYLNSEDLSMITHSPSLKVTTLSFSSSKLYLSFKML